MCSQATQPAPLVRPARWLHAVEGAKSGARVGLFLGPIASQPEPTPQGSALTGLRGRIGELSGAQPAALLTMAARWVVEAQREGEPALWVTTPHGRLYPPDLADAGVDLERLVVVRVPDAAGVARAADFLLRSGGAGLVVLDLLAGPPRNRGWPNRLLSLAIAHQSAIVCLTTTPAEQPSLSSLVSLRLDVQLERAGRRGLDLHSTVLKDKRGMPYRTTREACRGPLGLR